MSKDTRKPIADMAAVFRTFPPAVAARMEAEYVAGLRDVELRREAAKWERERAEAEGEG